VGVSKVNYALNESEFFQTRQDCTKLVIYVVDD